MMKIEGFFADMKAANKTAAMIRESNLGNAVVDMNEHYRDDRNVRINSAGTETAESLSGLVLESDAHGIGREKAPLNAASPMASGFGRFDEIADVTCKVIVDVGEKDAERVRQMIKNEGGELENPNIQKPRIHNDREFDLYDRLDALREERKREGY